MSRIETRFETLHSQGRKALIPYITAGDPHPNVTVDAMHALVEAGADIIELGVPFSDPMADGPVIQKACERALRHNVSLTDCLNMVRRFRERDDDTPIVLMGYLNPIEAMGYENFAAEAAEAGVDGVLTVDLPPDEGDGLKAALDAQGLDAIFLIAPTTTPDRLKRIGDAAGGFIYYVSLKGVTGAGNLDVDAVAAKLARIREVTSLPLGVGFGIRDAVSAAAVSQIADAVIVGSALVQEMGALAETPDAIPARVSAILSDMRAAMDKA